jgi:Na+/H+-dicarboxylate symporter
MDGCGAIYPAIAALFIAQYLGLELSLTQYVLIGLTAVLGSLGTAGVPGTSIVMLTLTLSTVGLPLEGIGYIVAVDRVVDMMRTATNVTGQMLVPVLVAKEEGLLDQAIYDGRAEGALAPASDGTLVPAE